MGSEVRAQRRLNGEAEVEDIIEGSLDDHGPRLLLVLL